MAAGLTGRNPSGSLVKGVIATIKTASLLMKGETPAVLARSLLI